MQKPLVDKEVYDPSLDFSTDIEIEPLTPGGLAPSLNHLDMDSGVEEKSATAAGPMSSESGEEDTVPDYVRPGRYIDVKA